ncbi:MAG: GyrI-like domain-containing protein [Clostridiales bacterium]|nr:GyrI-like domain-containing protein [Candidatus Apopatocola equi]MCQ2438355.1 GyrI-like domain-containing protein [Oscillospiraceae bacterium]
MKYEMVDLEAFSVIGKEGSSEEGPTVVRRLWSELQAGLKDIAPVVLLNNGKIKGVWGLMSDFSRSGKPWEDNFTKGLYLAGVECRPGSSAKGWSVWDVPAATYLKVDCEDGYPFREGLARVEMMGLVLSGAVLDYTDPETQKNYLLYPVEFPVLDGEEELEEVKD